MKLNSILETTTSSIPRNTWLWTKIVVKFNLHFNRVPVGYHTVLKLPTGASLLYIADMEDNYALFGKEKWVVKRDRDTYVKKMFKTFGIKQLMYNWFFGTVGVGKIYNLYYLISKS